MLDLLYPPRCEGCGELRRAPICPDCRAAIALLQPPMCELCGEPFDPQAAAGPRCAVCVMARRRFSVARSAAYYEGPLVQLIWRYKYHCQIVLAVPLARLMIAALETTAGALDPETVDVVCAVPLHPSRLRERGFNQSELLAEHLAAAMGRPLRPLLVRTRPTRPQVDLPLRSRAANVRGAFAPNPEEAIPGQRVLLIDDLFTTGATIAACVRSLHRAGAAELRVFTLARPLPGWRRPAAEIRAGHAAEAAG